MFVGTLFPLKHPFLLIFNFKFEKRSCKHSTHLDFSSWKILKRSVLSFSAMIHSKKNTCVRPLHVPRSNPNFFIFSGLLFIPFLFRISAFLFIFMYEGGGHISQIVPMEVRKQLVDSSCLLPSWDSRDQIQVTRLGVRHFDLLSYLMGPCLMRILIHSLVFALTH